MADEKRVKLGVDIGELSNQLVQINNVIEQNYQKALQGQSEYNKILEESLQLLQRQVDLVGQLGQQNQMGPSISAPQSESIGGGEDDKSSKLNELIEGILADVDGIWNKFSALTTPIPVEVVNTPLKVKLTTEDSSESSGAAAGAAAGGGAGGIAGGVAGGVAGDAGRNNRSGSGVSNALGQGTNIVAGAASDPNYLISGLAGMIPVVGAGIASILNKMIGEAEQRVKARAVFMGATGGNMAFQSLHGIGLKNAEAYQKEAQYYPANIHLKLKDLEFEKGYNVGGGTMESLLRAMREDVIQERYGTSSSELGVTYLTQLRGEGNIDSKKIRGYTEDYLKILIDLNQKQLETTGETNSLINGEVVAGIAKTSEKFGDPTVLKRVVEGIQGGLTQAPSAQAEALQYWAMSQANPEADIWQMQLMRETPFSEESRGYFSNYLNTLLQTGNANDVRFNVMNAFGLTAHQTEEFLNGISKAQQKQGESFNLTDYLEGFDLRGLTSAESSFNTNAGNQIRREAGRATAKNEVLLAQAADRLADVGEPILKFTNQAIEKTGEVVDMLGNFFDKGLSDALKDWWQNIKKDLKEMITPNLFGGGNDKHSTSVSNSNSSYPIKKNNINPNHP